MLALATRFLGEASAATGRCTELTWCLDMQVQTTWLQGLNLDLDAAAF